MMRTIQFTPTGEIASQRSLRSRIKENFAVADIQAVCDIVNDLKMSNNNERVDALKYTLRDKEFAELGAGTNRYAMLKDGYVFKFALDNYGLNDNWTEFNVTKKAQPAVTKTYECNGLIAVAGYVNIMDLETFRLNKEVIRGLLAVLAEDFLFEDLGCIDKNFRNWGFDDQGNIVALDYGYMYERDEALIRCTKCGSRIGYTPDYDQMICENCKTKFDIFDIKRIVEATDDERAEMFKNVGKKRKKVKVGFRVGSKQAEDCRTGQKKSDDNFQVIVSEKSRKTLDDDEFAWEGDD